MQYNVTPAVLPDWIENSADLDFENKKLADSKQTANSRCRRRPTACPLS